MEDPKTFDFGTFVQREWCALSRTDIGQPPPYNRAANRKKPDSGWPGRHDRPGLVAYLNRGSVAPGRCGSLKIWLRKQDGEARWGLRRGDVIETIGARKAIAPVVRDCIAAANGMDLSK